MYLYDFTRQQYIKISLGYFQQRMIPIDIINQILAYVADLNNSTIITQYDPITNREYHKINLRADSLWRIKSALVMKRIYPVYTYHLNGNYNDQYSGFINKGTIELYKHYIPHYERQLRNDPTS